MITAEIINGIWNYYLSLEKDLDDTSRYIEPKGQENVFSFEFAKLLVLSCTELESVLKLLCYECSGEKRGNIGMVKPSGWHTIKYDNIDGKYLYNRCHLIGYQLTGQNANVKNLITCTRNMNSVSMLEFENKVSSYIKETNNHVLYRVTPIYDGDNLLASGVVMEAYSIEDSGEGIKFNVFIYNVQDGIEIDYKTGDSKRIE